MSTEGPVQTSGGPSVADTVLDAVRNLAPAVTARAPEVETERRIPIDLHEALAAAGCFRMLLPSSHGGGEIDLPGAMRVHEALSRADGSVGWTVMISASGWCDVAGLPRATFDALYADGPGIVVGAFNPTGAAERADDGYLVSGRWAFVSGCERARWLYANCIETDGEDHRLRTVVFSPAEVEIQDTWRVSGLCGTGSHHVVADGVTVANERTFPTMEADPTVDTPVVRIPAPALFSLQIASVALGIAQGAIDDVLGLSTDKVPLLAGSPLADNPLFQYRIATAATAVQAARSLLYGEAEAAWVTAAGGAPFTLRQRAAIRAAAAWTASTAARAVDAAYEAGGGSALYLDNPLQRRLRDIHALTQHFLVKPDTFTTVGAVLAGREPDLPVF